mmetsp:Transcript_21745/g.49442  ORF Transcript_21745/g.49442 Transcript_21745/m.49442 type:complete len:551 (-) Transcript_21745:457-2109(-)
MVQNQNSLSISKIDDNNQLANVLANNVSHSALSKVPSPSILPPSLPSIVLPPRRYHELSRGGRRRRRLSSVQDPTLSIKSSRAFVASAYKESTATESEEVHHHQHHAATKRKVLASNVLEGKFRNRSEQQEGTDSDKGCNTHASAGRSGDAADMQFSKITHREYSTVTTYTSAKYSGVRLPESTPPENEVLSKSRRTRPTIPKLSTVPIPAIQPSSSISTPVPETISRPTPTPKKKGNAAASTATATVPAKSTASELGITVGDSADLHCIVQEQEQGRETTPCIYAFTSARADPPPSVLESIGTAIGSRVTRGYGVQCVGTSTTKVEGHGVSLSNTMSDTEQISARKEGHEETFSATVNNMGGGMERWKKPIGQSYATGVDSIVHAVNGGQEQRVGSSVREGYEYCDNISDVQIHAWACHWHHEGRRREGGLFRALSYLSVSMFGYMTDLDLVDEVLGKEYFYAAMKEVSTLKQLDIARCPANRRGDNDKDLEHFRVEARGHDLHSLIFNFLDEWLLRFHMFGFVAKKVCVTGLDLDRYVIYIFVFYFCL